MRAAADLGRRYAGLLGDDAGGELLGRHFQREEADDAAIDGRHVAVGADLARPGLGDVVGDVGGERGFAHAGTAGEDDQVGGLQAAHARVEIGQAGRDARQVAVALVGAGRHVDRGGQRLGEALEAGIVTAGLGDFVEFAFGVLDVASRRGVDRRVVGEVDHVLADRDQIAADREVVDGAAVILGVDDGRRLGGEPRQILIDRQARRYRGRPAGTSSASPASPACWRGPGRRPARRCADGCGSKKCFGSRKSETR